MEGISDIKVTGIDETRPPRIRKEPYIDIVFRLSHQAPPDWCKDFNNLTSRHSSPIRIKETEGKFIETWVRKPDEIVSLLDYIKTTVAVCSDEYIARIERLAQNAKDNNAAQKDEPGEQGRLNRIIAELEFDIEE